jgi:CheY-like chemotaxis protein
MNPSSSTILQVEDSEDDVFMMKRVLKKAGVSNPLHVVWDGQEAVEYLEAALDPARRDTHPLPFLVLLDLKLPYRDGFEVLEWIRRQPALAALQVVMLTGSGETRDRQRALALGARAYLVKPATIDDMRRLLASLEAGGRPAQGDCDGAAPTTASSTGARAG